jgi:hypothetical protein
LLKSILKTPPAKVGDSLPHFLPVQSLMLIFCEGPASPSVYKNPGHMLSPIKADVHQVVVSGTAL